MNKKVVIVGSGFGGLTTALRLAKKGYQVEILEKNTQPGGRLNQIRKDGFTFDTGPSFFTMSYEFERFAKECEIKLPFSYYPLEPLYTVNFASDNRLFYLYRDIDKLSQQFEALEPAFKHKMQTYLRQAQQVYEDTVDLVIKKNFDSKLDYFKTLSSVNFVHFPLLFRNFWQEVARYFTSQEARQIISLVAFFLGRTPFDTMAVYMLLSYVEFQHDGYYNVQGGMYQIVEGLRRELAKERVQFHFQTEIVDFLAQGNKLLYVIDQHGRKWDADIFVINADAAYFRGKIFKRKKFSEKRLSNMKWTMGYLTMYVGLNCKLPNVDHHNYFLGDNYQYYARHIEKDTQLLHRPYYYVNVLSKHNLESAPEGGESLFFVCPVPNLLYKSNWDDKDAIAENILEDFSRRIGKNILPHVVSKTIYTPEDWEKRFNLFKGNGLGLAHDMWQIGAFRPANYDEEFSNLFYVGASTIPGTGLPMVLIGSKLVTERVEKFAAEIQ